MILALTESTIPLNFRTIGPVLRARFKRERVEIYNADLVYLLVKRYYENVDAPGEHADKVMMPKADANPQKDGSIIDNLIKKLGG